MRLLSTIVVVSIVAVRAVAAQHAPAPREGGEIFRAACAACHGADGKGQPISTVGFETPLPDFTNCSFATPETAADWISIAHEGGPVRAFDRRMPAFGEVLTEDELGRTIDYVRSLCTERAWPRGELNLPRALVTEKAFPENEALLTTTIGGGDAATFDNVLLYERRLGARSQIELAVPLAMQKDGEDTWQHGLGDIAVAIKHALFHSLRIGHHRQRSRRDPASHWQRNPGPWQGRDDRRAVRRRWSVAAG